MQPATSFYTPTPTVASALLAQVQAVQFPNASAWGSGNAFGQVSLFDADDLVAAFEYLLLSAKQVAVVVIMDEQFRTESQTATKLIVRRTLSAAVLVSDQQLGDRVAATYGSTTTPGALGLAALTLPYVTGQLVTNPAGVRSEPRRVSVGKVGGTERQLPMRAFAALELDLIGGRFEAATTPVV